MSWQILEGDCLDVLRSLDAGSVQTCVTSPPYWGLRDYGTAAWEGGDPECDHRQERPVLDDSTSTLGVPAGGGERRIGKDNTTVVGKGVYRNTCGKCGATRIDSQLGLEPTPEQYVENLVAVFREVRRVLRDDGTVWLNLGDSYATGTGRNDTDERNLARRALTFGTGTGPGTGPRSFSPMRHPTKPKDLVGIPWRVAFALQADGWVLRQEVIWQKPNPMPESVTDRCTRAHEQIFMFSKGKWSGAEEPPLAMIRENAAWLAALVDGEGSICFQDRTSKGAAVPTYSVRLSIVNTHRGLLERVAEICGFAGVGAPSPRTRSDGSNGRPVYAWQVTNAKAARVIGAIRPYLVAKGAQADLALAVQALNRKHKGRGGHRVSAADDAFKRRCSEACSALNHGEIPDLSWFTPARAGRWVSQPYAYDADAIREAHESNGQGGFSNKSTLKSVLHGQAHAPSLVDAQVNPAGRNRRSVWTVTTQPFPGAHFATFPPKLIEPCVLAGAAEGATVLDPFAGAGTAGLVATQHGRDFIGIELNPEYAEMARERIRAFEANPNGHLPGDPEPIEGQLTLDG